MVLGTAVLGGTAAAVRHGTVSRFEANLFRLINQLPSALEGPLWVVMQGGALAAVFVMSGIAALVGRWRMARDLPVSGMLAWLAAKLVKAGAGRARPGVMLPGVILRHGAQGGMGFPSGHVAVAAALATAAAPYLPRRYRRLAWTEVGLVAVARVYVGAHLPLDTLGGAALGWTIGSAVHLVWGAPGGRLTIAAVRRGLASLGLPTSTIQAMCTDARGSTPFLISDSAGRSLFVKVVGQQQRDSDWPYRAWRHLFYRRTGDEAPFATPKQLVEHEAYLSLLAARAGVRTLAQLASSAANRVTPGGTGTVATIARYLERSGLSRTEAVSAVTLTSAASVVVHVTAFGIVAALLAQVGIRAVHLPSRWVVLFVVIGVAVAVGLLFWSPPGRRKVLPVIREGARSLRAVLRRPPQAAKVFVGALGVTFGDILALYWSLLAFGAHPSMLTVTAAYLVGDAIGSASPAPGGLGATEAALVAGLIRLGVDAGQAIASVLTFRLITYWLPMPPGAVALRLLQRDGVL